ncbi:protein IRX15-LIKE-like [Chenopodium quinoa]|nr:protein IRX15-LIKE-like [Chenopodium quinoa]
MKTTPKLIVFHPSLYKQSSSTISSLSLPSSLSHRIWVLVFFTLFTFTFLLTVFKNTTLPPPTPPTTPSTTANHQSAAVSAALLHYAAISNTTDRMTSGELSAVATALRRCSPPCNFLIFGLTHETLLWRALNSGGRTVFLDENEYLISKFEQNFTDFEGYDVQYTTKVGKSAELIEHSRIHRKGDCRPVQNLLFSECKLAINDLPNHLYEISWDVILIDGPRGYSAKMPGRMAAIFSAAVMGRSRGGERKSGKRKGTEIFVHDYGREVERVFSEEFLCKENLVEVRDSLAHFVVKEMKGESFEFCLGESSNSS